MVETNDEYTRRNLLFQNSMELERNEFWDRSPVWVETGRPWAWVGARSEYR
jgi:hypothetical protein